MTSNLNWRPTRFVSNELSDELKFILRKVFSEPVDIVLDENSRDFLKGVGQATNNPKVAKDCETLLKAIEKHDCIVVKEEY